jgi:hypothetical protein
LEYLTSTLSNSDLDTVFRFLFPLTPSSSTPSLPLLTFSHLSLLPLLHPPDYFRMRLFVMATSESNRVPILNTITRKWKRKPNFRDPDTIQILSPREPDSQNTFMDEVSLNHYLFQQRVSRNFSRFQKMVACENLLIFVFFDIVSEFFSDFHF